MADDRTQQQRQNDQRGGPAGVPTRVDQGRQRDAHLVGKPGAPKR